jgi:L-rhamnose isomerase
MNRIGAYVIGTRATQQAFLLGLLEPADQLKTYEDNSMNFEKLAMLEIMKTMPFGAVWDYYCLINDVPIGTEYITEIQTYEKEVLNKR